jgi:isocitrate dehydrogenase
MNQYRVRVQSKNEQPVTQQAIFAEVLRVAEHLKICSVEMLMTYDGKKAFSLAQGQ